MNHRSGPRRALALLAALLAVLLWLVAVFTWTAATRVSTAGGVADVTVETVQSPAGADAVTDALVDTATAYATSQGFDLTATAQEQISTELEQAVQSAQFPGLMGPAIQQAREAYEAAPDGPITIDFAALRPLAVEQVQQVNPALVKAIPPAEDLTVTVQKQNVPPLMATLAEAASTLTWLPLWLLLGALALGALGLWASGNRPRMLRWLGIGSLLVAIVPVVMRASVPPIVGSFADGQASSIASTAATAILGHWWISMLVALVVGVALIGASIYASRGPGRPRGPVVLGR